MRELERGAVRVTAEGGPAIAPHHTTVEVWTGVEWLKVGGVSRISFEIDARDGEYPCLGTLELTVHPGSVRLNADPGQVVLRDAIYVEDKVDA